MGIIETAGVRRKRGYDRMLTYSFAEIGSDTLYHYLYECIKKDIITEHLKEGERLPSKRSFAENLGVSVITVENAYAQLMAEGYIYSIPQKGFFVEKLPNKVLPGDGKESVSEEAADPVPVVDFSSSRNHPDSFPFSVWTKLNREIMARDKYALMTPSPANGVYALRLAICQHLADFRGMKVDPSRIIIGAGTEYLYSLLIQLLGYDKVYAVEDPGYKKLYRIYGSNHVACRAIPMDGKGIHMERLRASDTDVLHIAPAHHFPTGIVTPIGRRYELLSWAAESERRYIIEDDFDSEFRMVGKSIPMLQSIDIQEKVIYMNTFSKSLTATIRISYMVLPPHLAVRFHEKLGFYACTVSTFEQLTLAEFIAGGYYERHINRMRTYYKNLQKRLLETVRSGPYASRVRITEEEAGLHFLLTVDTSLTDEEITKKAMEGGYRVLMLSECYMEDKASDTHTLVINFSGMSENGLDRINDLLRRIL